MPDRRDLLTTPAGKDGTARSPWRFVPLVAIVALSILIWLMGWHRHLTFESFVHQHAVLHGFIARDLAGSVAAYMVDLCPRGGTVGAGRAVPDGGGRHLVRSAPGRRGGIDRRDGRARSASFSIAKSALGEYLVRRAGPRVASIAEGFRVDAFSYLLFLRLVPVFPFWLVNLVPALCGVSFKTFALATALGMIPGTFAFTFVGAGLESVVVAQEAAYRACVAAGSAGMQARLPPQERDHSRDPGRAGGARHPCARSDRRHAAADPLHQNVRMTATQKARPWPKP